MHFFALKYARWKIRMAINLVAEKREYIALATGAGLMGLVGTLALWGYGSKTLAKLLLETPPAEVHRILSLLLFALYVAFVFMALANVITRFFGPQRMDEREQLMGPVTPNTMFVTELIDTFRLPLLVLVVGVFVPLIGTFRLTGLPLWLLAVVCTNLLELYLQPTLLVMVLYIVGLRFLPRRLLGSQTLLFLFFLLVACVGASALGTIRETFLDQQASPMTLPSSWAASLIPLYMSDHHAGLWWQSLRSSTLTLALLAVAFVLYRYAFLERLELFGLHTAELDIAGNGPFSNSLLRKILFRYLSPPVAAIVQKDLRSSRRDSAQRIAFTALAALICALVVVDLAGGTGNAQLFLPIFSLYALFLVSCQGLSTFSSEGGVLENLAQLPLEASQIYKAKVASHFLLFMIVFGVSLVLLTIAPSKVPLPFRVGGALVALPLTLPVALLLSWLSVTLGVLFPKPGEGGGRKEISVFAMGLYLEFLTLIGLSLAAAAAVPFAFGPLYGLLVPFVLIIWWGVGRFLHILAMRAVTRALGAELRGG